MRLARRAHANSLLLAAALCGELLAASAPDTDGEFVLEVRDLARGDWLGVGAGLFGDAIHVVLLRFEFADGSDLVLATREELTDQILAQLRIRDLQNGRH